METLGRETEEDQEIQPELEEARERELETEVRASQERFEPLLVALPRRFIVVFAARCAMRMRGLLAQAPDRDPFRQAARLADDIIAAAVETCLRRTDLAGGAKPADVRTTTYFNELVRIYDRNQKELRAIYSQLVPASRLAWTVFGFEGHLKERVAHNGAHAAAHALIAVFQAYPDGSDPATERACLEFALGLDLIKLAELDADSPDDRIGPPLDPRESGPLRDFWPSPRWHVRLEQMTPELTAYDDVIASFKALNEQIDRELQVVVIPKLRGLLGRLAGKQFDSLEANQAVAAAIQELLNRLGLRARCPGCGEPALLRCSRTNRARAGSFQFEHFVGGRQTRHTGSTTLPPLELVPAPSDRRRRQVRRPQT